MARDDVTAPGTDVLGQAFGDYDVPVYGGERMGLLGGLIAGGASLLGGILSNKSSSKQARRQMDFQERMSSTAHQREVADLRAAGLNPILSGTGGMGSASSAGAMAMQHDVLTPAIGSAQAQYRMAPEVRLIKANERRVRQDEEVGKSTVELQDAQAAEVDARKGLLHQQKLTEENRTKAEAEAVNVNHWMAQLHEANAKQAHRVFMKELGEIIENRAKGVRDAPRRIGEALAQTLGNLEERMHSSAKGAQVFSRTHPRNKVHVMGGPTWRDVMPSLRRRISH